MVPRLSWPLFIAFVLLVLGSPLLLAGLYIAWSRSSFAALRHITAQVTVTWSGLRFEENGEIVESDWTDVTEVQLPATGMSRPCVVKTKNGAFAFEGNLENVALLRAIFKSRGLIARPESTTGRHKQIWKR